MNVKESIKIVARSRTFLALWFLTFVQMIALIIIVLSFVHRNELQIPVHYSAFSDAQFYRDQWFYLLNFAAFGLLVFVINSFVGLKLFSEKGRSMAVSFMCITAAVFAISTVLILALLRVTSLLQ